MQSIVNNKSCKRHLMLYPFFIAIGIAINVMGCAQEEIASAAEDEQLVGLLGIYLATSGNCLHSYKAGTNAGLLHCSREARSLCGVDKKIDESGRLIVRSDRRQAYIAEWNWLIDIYTSCNLTAAILASQPAYTTTDTVKYSEIEGANVLQSVDTCDGIVSNQIDSLVSRGEYVFLNSARGSLALQAQRLSQWECRDALLGTTWQWSLVEDVANGNRQVQTSCRYGTNSAALLPGYTACTATEESAANQFDFN